MQNYTKNNYKIRVKISKIHKKYLKYEKTSSIIKIYVGAMQKHSEREKEGTEC